MPKRTITLLVTIVLSFFWCLSATAQVDDAVLLHKEHWNAGVFAGGGNGIGLRSGVHFFRAGGRIGRVMTGQKGSGLFRGTFELDSELTPVEVVSWPNYKSVYGFGFNPLVMKWNFTSGKKVVPFVEAVGGLLWTTENIPPGDTAQINFQSGAGFGMHIFTRPNRAITLDIRATHISNASIGNHNPGVNASVQFTLGYTWFRK